ncbi:MsnO8 family LLM class oxidoreductase [Streptomyces sp. SCSIO 75703]|uniref:MsnO8 family LLM class oxidoreductase n=1 Tax=unclassified Streptomyces TaxID=2593676 RepID=UPI000565FA37|nr:MULTISPECIES: MsnO8 family LLM class oxidoreductase [unclassified Streptomyces]
MAPSAPRLSVLDQSPVGTGFSAADALHASVDLAQAAEEWGHVRYWTAEHHGSPGFAGSAPEILASVLLARTERMRVGTGGVLLPLYPPAKVAEVFGVLASLFPGRVDLGLGRAGGPAHDYPQRVRAVRRLMDLDGDGPPAGAGVNPVATVRPRMWLLGGGVGSAFMAGELGTDYAFAHFLVPGPARAALTSYRSAYTEHTGRPAPGGVLAVRVVTAASEERAEALAQSVLLWRSRKDLGDDLPLPTPAEALRHEWTALEAERAEVRRGSLVWGTPEQVRERLTELAARHGVCELMVNTLTCDPADRLDSHRLLAEAFAARPRPAAAGR